MATTKLTVKIDGPEKENTDAITVGDKRWGLNGAQYGTEQKVTQGEQTVTAYKNSEPKQLSSSLNVAGKSQTVTVTVDKDSLAIS